MFTGNTDKTQRQVLVYSACCEALDRSAQLRSTVVTAAEVLLVTEIDLLETRDLHGKWDWHLTWVRLRQLRTKIHLSESELDASMKKICLFTTDKNFEAPFADGHFSDKVERAIDNLRDNHDQDRGESTNHLSTNYLIREEIFPFGNLFSEQKCQKFFDELEAWLNLVVKKVAS